MPTGVYIRTEKYRKEVSKRNKRLGIKWPGTFGLHWKLSDKNRENQSKAQQGIKRPYANPPHYKGKDHWNWKNGITPINYLIRQSKKYKSWQQAVYKKDNWTCQICKKHCHDDIVAHHILSFNDFIEQRFLVSNGVVLCRKCHINLHRLTETNRQ